MELQNSQAITQLLEHWRQGDSKALDRCFHLIYEDLWRNAKHLIDRQTGCFTLSATDLAHEAYLRLVRYPMHAQKQPFANRKQFFGLAQKAMVHILIDYHRRKIALRHGGGLKKVSLESFDHAHLPPCLPDILGLEQVLGELAHTKPDWYHVLHQRFLAESPATVAELAKSLNSSSREIYRKTNWCLAWLRRRLKPPGPAI